MHLSLGLVWNLFQDGNFSTHVVRINAEFISKVGLLEHRSLQIQTLAGLVEFM